MAMKLAAVRKPLAARLACCSKPFMASTNALLRWSVMPRTTASNRSLMVVASFLNGSSRQRRAQLSQARRSTLACSALLCPRAWRLKMALQAVYAAARALLSAECCSQCMALICGLLQPDGLRRMPHISCLSVLRSLAPSAERTAGASSCISARRT
jgi:hypothetical protein